MFTIYCHTSPSGKRYVGQTSQSMARRWSAHVTAARAKGRQCSALYAAIRKYGGRSFAHEELDRVFTREDANAAEIRWIATLGTRVPVGYNLAEGGRAGSHHAETRARMSAAAKAREARLTADEKSARAYKASASKTPEERRAYAIRAATAHPTEERRATARARERVTPEERARRTAAVVRGKMAIPPDERSDAARRGRAAMTADRRSEIAIKANANRSLDAQREAIRASWAAVPPENRADRNRKAWATRRARRGLTLEPV